MAWSWIRPRSPEVLAPRPLLDLGTGDGQTLRALTGRQGLRVGMDRSLEALKAAAREPDTIRFVRGNAHPLPFRSGAFRTVLAADLFHHLPDDALGSALGEVARVLSGDGQLIAWWYERPSRPGPDAPAVPRSYEEVAAIALRAGFASARPLPLIATLEPAPATAGLLAAR